MLKHKKDASLYEDLSIHYGMVNTLRRKFAIKDNYTVAANSILIAMRNHSVSLSLKEICDIQSITPSNGSVIVNKLVEDELITRTQCAQDRRKIVLELTLKGQAHADYLLKAQHDAYKNALACLTEKDRETLHYSMLTMDSILARLSLDVEG